MTYNTIGHFNNSIKSRCIVCNGILLHIPDSKRTYTKTLIPYDRCAHTTCAILMRTLRNLGLKAFAMKCIKYEINNTDKAFYIKIGYERLCLKA